MIRKNKSSIVVCDVIRKNIVTTLLLIKSSQLTFKLPKSDDRDGG